jgi:biotin synthase
MPKDQSLEVLAFVDKSWEELLSISDNLRKKYKKNTVFTCAIMNAKSGACPENCAFCAQSIHHKTNIKMYPLVSVEKMVREAERMKESGATRFSIVTSGKKPSKKELDRISEAIYKIKEKIGIQTCASLGILDKESAVILKEAGLERYHHNLETSESFFPNICTTHSYKEDIDTVKIAKQIGLKVCSGGIIGLGETWKHRIELALTLRGLNVDSIPINFLNPIPGTRLQNMPLISPFEALKAVAIFRIVNPEKDITVCGGREKVLKEFQDKVFKAGANGIMIGNYLTTKGRSIREDMEMIKEQGLKLEGRK